MRKFFNKDAQKRTCASRSNKAASKKLEYRKKVNKMICASVAAVLILAGIVPALATIEWPTNITRFERVSPVETLTVDQGTTEAKDLDLPTSLRAIVPLAEDADASTFLQAEPVVDTSDGSETYDYYYYGYVAPKNAAEIYAVEKAADQEKAIYFITYAKQDATGSTTGEVADVAYRVYGSIEGGTKSWFACEEDGTITGQVVDVPVTWDTSTYKKDELGTYSVQASFTGYTYNQARPFAKVTVKEVAQCTCGAAEGEDHAEDCPLHTHTDECENADGVIDNTTDDDAFAGMSDEELLDKMEAEAADDQAVCTCGAAEGEEHAKDCALYVELAENCHCAEDGGAIAASNYPWAHKEDCVNFSPIECMCKVQEEKYFEYFNEFGEDKSFTMTINGEFSHEHDANNVDCPLYGQKTVQVRKTSTGETTYMEKDVAEKIVAHHDAAAQSAMPLVENSDANQSTQSAYTPLYPALGEIEIVGTGSQKASGNEEGGFDPLGAIVDFFTPEQAHAAIAGVNSDQIDAYMRSKSPTSGNPDTSYSFEYQTIYQKGSWTDYLNTIWMNKAYGKMDWTPHANTGAYNGWTWSGATATQATGTVQTNPLRIPAVAGTSWEVYSGEQLRYAMEHMTAGQTIQIRGNLDLAGYDRNWTPVVKSSFHYVIEGNNFEIYNLGVNQQGQNWVSMFTSVWPDWGADTPIALAQNLTFRTAKICGDVTKEGAAPLVAFSQNSSLDNYSVYDSLIYGGDSSACFSVQSMIPYKSQYTNCFSENNYIYGKNHVSAGHSGANGSFTKNVAVDNLIVGIGAHSGGVNSCAGYSGSMWIYCASVNEMYSNAFSGMLAGQQKGATYRVCFASGKMEGLIATGGLIGIVPGNVTIDRCYATTLVGLRTQGSSLGGLVGYANGTYTDVAHTMSVSNSYAAGEVGNYDTNMSAPATIGGFYGAVNSDYSRTFTKCYYDKQTSAMREWAAGNSQSVAGVTGVLTTDTENANGFTVSGLTSAPGIFGYIGFDDNSQWTFDAEHYPQLNYFLNGSSALWGTQERADLIAAYSKASASTVLLDTWQKGYDWDSNGVRTASAVSYDRTLASTGKVDHAGNFLTYDTVREIISDAPVTKQATWSHLIAGGAPVDCDSDGVADGNAMEISATNGLEIKTPGMDWYKIETSSGSQTGWRPIRLISYMGLDAGSDQRLTPGVTYDHRQDVDLTMMDKITENLVVGIDDSKIWSTAMKGGYPNTKKYWAVETTNMETNFTASKQAWMYTEIWRAEQNPDGSFVTNATSGLGSEQLMPDLSVKVTGAGTGNNLTLTEQKWNGDLPLYEDTSYERKYLITYYWMLKDGRYRADTKTITITPGDYDINVNVLNLSDGTPNTTALLLGAAEDTAAGSTGYTYTSAAATSEQALNVGYTKNASAAWKNAHDSVAVKKTQIKLTGPDGTTRGDITVTGELKLGSTVTLPVRYYYNTYEWDAAQKANREVTSTQIVNTTYTVEDDGQGGMTLRFNKLANPPSDEMAAALTNSVSTGIATTDSQGKPTTAYINEMMYDIDITLWVDEGMDFSFIKVDENGQPMVGVEFQLYECTHVHNVLCGGLRNPDRCNHYHKLDGSGNVIPGDNHSELADNSAGCCWNVASPLHTMVSDATGRVTFPEMISGDYMLAETKTLPGYQLPDGQWLLHIDTIAETVTIEARGATPPPAFKVNTDENTGEITYEVANYRQWILPFTGGVGAILFTVVGVVLVGTGAVVFVLSRKRRK